jgi:hypothetical protein
MDGLMPVKSDALATNKKRTPSRRDRLSTGKGLISQANSLRIVDGPAIEPSNLRRNRRRNALHKSPGREPTIDDLERAGADHESRREWLDAFENHAQAVILQQLWCASVTRRPHDPDYEARLNSLSARQREARRHLTS